MKRNKAEIIARMNEVGTSVRFCNGSCPTERKEQVGEIDVESRTVPFIMVSKENAGERYDWWEGETYIEELDVTGASWSRLQTFFKDHFKSVESAIGRVTNIRLDAGEIKADVIFSKDEDADAIFQKYVDGVLSDVSIGYRVNDIVVTDKKNEPKHILVTDFDIVELSAVWMGFDAGASIGREVETPPTPANEEAVEYDKRDVSVMLKLLKLKQGE